jgi:hypothetical protein
VSSLTTQLVGGAATLDVDFLLVGGGGGGNSNSCNGAGAGGGGAGGFVTGSGIIGKDTYTVKVGAGGAGTQCKLLEQRTVRLVHLSVRLTAAVAVLVLAGQIGAVVAVAAASTETGGIGISGEGNAGGNSSDHNRWWWRWWCWRCRWQHGCWEYGGNGGAASTNDYTGSSISYSGGGGGGVKVLVERLAQTLATAAQTQ